MRCAWDAFVVLLPVWLRSYFTKKDSEMLTEVRLRIGLAAEMVYLNGSKWTRQRVVAEDIQFCINVASQYSPWSAETISHGYITASGGHRIGICGEAISSESSVKGIRTPRYLCLRLAKDFSNIADGIAPVNGSVLIIGPPGSGKTTLLRDLIRQKSNAGKGSIAVVDERRELFPYFNNSPCFDSGSKTDVISGACKKQGVEMVLRVMGPTMIAVDEITAEEDCRALIHAGWCGVDVFATAHAANISDLQHRPVYKPLLETGLFSNVVVLRSDKSWSLERMKTCTLN